MTYSSHEPSSPDEPKVSFFAIHYFAGSYSCCHSLCELLVQRVVINIFDVRTGKVMRDFKGTTDEFAAGSGGVSGVSWPVFK